MSVSVVWLNDMDSEDENQLLLGFDECEAITLDTIKKKFKTKILNGDISVLDLSAGALDLLKSIGASFGHTILDRVFRNAVESSSFMRNENCIELCISGFKSVTHQRLLKSLEKKFPQKSKSLNYIDFELYIPNMTIPYLKKETFAALRIQATSTKTRLKFKLIGDSAFIFILFYLRKLLELFLKNLPVPLSECYSPSDRSVTSTSSYDTEDSSPKVKKIYKRIIQKTRTKGKMSEGRIESESSSNSDIICKPFPKQNLKCDDGLFVNKKRKCPGNETPEQSSVKTLPESGSPVFKRRRKENPRTEDCTECAMFYVARNVKSMVEPDMQLRLTCTDNCWAPDHLDAMDDMRNAINEIIGQSDSVNKMTIDNFYSNFKGICDKIVDKTIPGRSGFYFKMLESLSTVVLSEANKIVTVMNEISIIFIDNNKIHFEENLDENKAARRSLIAYLKSTGAFFSVISVIESFYKMFLKNFDLDKILPPKLHSIVKMFQELPARNSRQIHHQNMSHVARRVLKLLKTSNIDVIELKKKEFRIGNTGRTIHKHMQDDLFLYFNKVENNLYVFLFSEQRTVAKALDLENATYDQEQKIITTNEWIFEIENPLPNNLLSVFFTTDKYPRTAQVPDMTIKPKSESENELNSETNSNDGEGDQSSTGEIDLEPTMNCVIPLSFRIEKNHIKKYWTGNTKVNQKRKFNTTRVGLDWPKMYGGGCAIVIDYNYVTKYGSRKVRANFAKGSFQI